MSMPMIQFLMRALIQSIENENKSHNVQDESNQAEDLNLPPSVPTEVAAGSDKVSSSISAHEKGRSNRSGSPLSVGELSRTASLLMVLSQENIIYKSNYRLSAPRNVARKKSELATSKVGFWSRRVAAKLKGNVMWEQFFVNPKTGKTLSEDGIARKLESRWNKTYEDLKVFYKPEVLNSTGNCENLTNVFLLDLSTKPSLKSFLFKYQSEILHCLKDYKDAQLENQEVEVAVKTTKAAKRFISSTVSQQTYKVGFCVFSNPRTYDFFC